VIVMTDTVVAVRTEAIRKPDLSKLTLEHRLTWEPGKNGSNGSAGHSPDGSPHADGSPYDEKHGYLRYQLTESGISPMAIPGTPGGQYVAMGLEHNERSRHRPDPRTHTQMTEKRFRKIEGSVQDAPEAVTYGDPNADIAIVTWGSTAGVAIEAIDLLKEEGINACLVAPRMVMPLPKAQLDSYLAKKHVIVPEVNFRGQFADILQAAHPRPVARVNVYGGRPMLVAKFVEAVKQIASGPVENTRIALDPIFGRLEELVTPDDLIAPVERQ
jgi:2-oxoglutarate ferredoxin oxidoreductase subunit alpha